jgi:hypothetical protein
MVSPVTAGSTGGGTVADTAATLPTANINVPTAHANNKRLRINDQ